MNVPTVTNAADTLVWQITIAAVTNEIDVSASAVVCQQLLMHN
jgi:hypothetical protein